MFKTETGKWESPDGKLIEFTREVYFLDTNDDITRWSIQITHWPKNTSIEAVATTGECADYTDSEDRWLHEVIFRIAKMPKDEFNEKRCELIRKCEEFVARRTGDAL